MTQGVEHDEAISIYALHMQARRLLRRHSPSPLSPALTPRNDNSEVFQQRHEGGSGIDLQATCLPGDNSCRTLRFAV